MSGLTNRTVHIDTPLTNLVLSFIPKDFIVDQLFPVVNVSKQSDLYYKYSQEDFFRLPENTVWAPKTVGNAIEYGVTSESYFCTPHALIQEIPFQVLANADAALQPEKAASKFLWTKHMLAWESRVASKLTSGSNVGSYTTLSGVNQWDKATSDPCGDIQVGKDAVASTTGYEPNLCIIGQDSYSKLLNHPQILERIKYVQKGQVTSDILALLFDVQRVLIGKQRYNSAKENAATGTYASLWGDNALLAYVSTAPAAFGSDPSLGLTFRWNAFNASMNAPFMVERFVDDKVRTTTIRVSYAQDEKITASALSYLITDTNA